MNITQLLTKNLHLSEAETRVYIAALELGEGSLQDIAEKSGVKRTSIYNFLSNLKEKGFLQQTHKRKRKIYTAADPKQLLEKEKLRLAQLEELLPELSAIQNTSRTKPRVTFYEGIENVLSVYDDQLKERKPIIAFEDLEYMQRAMPKHFYKNWPRERARRNITFKSIARDSVAARVFTKHNRGLLRETKLVPAKPWKTEINIYGNKIAIMRFHNDHAMCVVIEDEDIANTLRAAWQMLWERLDVPILQ